MNDVQFPDTHKTEDDKSVGEMVNASLRSVNGMMDQIKKLLTHHFPPGTHVTVVNEHGRTWHGIMVDPMTKNAFVNAVCTVKDLDGVIRNVDWDAVSTRPKE